MKPQILVFYSVYLGNPIALIASDTWEFYSLVNWFNFCDSAKWRTKIQNHSRMVNRFSNPECGTPNTCFCSQLHAAYYISMKRSLLVQCPKCKSCNTHTNKRTHTCKNFKVWLSWNRHKAEMSADSCISLCAAERLRSSYTIYLL